jgi:hypothetical protein
VTIDLAGVPFVSGGTAFVVSGTTSTTLQIVEGGTSATLKLDPTVSYAADTFKLVSDGRVGTDVIVTDPPLGSSVFTLLSVGDLGADAVVTDPPLASPASAAVSPRDLLYSGGTQADTPASAPYGNGALQGGQDIHAWSAALAALGIGDFSGDILFRENTGGVGSNQPKGNGGLNGLQRIGDASGILGEHLGKGDSDLLFRGDKPAVGAISGDENLHGSPDTGDSSTIHKMVR